jgi:hypothetical protein
MPEPEDQGATTAPRRGLFDRDPSAGDQLATVQALAVIVEQAAHRKLLPITWTVGDLGSSLVARSDQNASTGPSYDHDSAATAALRRRVYEQYLALLVDLEAESVATYGRDKYGDGRFATELNIWPERKDGLGYVRLTAVLKHVTIPLPGRGNRTKFLHTIVVAADLDYSDLEQQS